VTTVVDYSMFQNESESVTTKVDFWYKKRKLFGKYPKQEIVRD